MPRWFEVLSGAELWVALTLSILFAIYGHRVGVGGAKVGEVATVALAYAAVAFGFSLAGLTLALTLPDADFANELATTIKGEPRSAIRRFTRKFESDQADAYSELLFIFSWTAIAHWLTVVVSFAFLIKFGFDDVLVPVHASVAHRVAIGIWAFVATYAVSLFLVTLITLSQVGQVYIRRLRKRSASQATP